MGDVVNPRETGPTAGARATETSNSVYRIQALAKRQLGRWVPGAVLESAPCTPLLVLKCKSEGSLQHDEEMIQETSSGFSNEESLIHTIGTHNSEGTTIRVESQSPTDGRLEHSNTECLAMLHEFENTLFKDNKTRDSKALNVNNINNK
ncbi:hypothetical protein NDU88_006898 [Pleurodeles waltl]|uniref:Uncharacterized protein n=1 Tax=Pleurodeles waltl TaxID=8319 RepID=A0AAV7SQW2_PLEWA|nr:hypothetical protein NDU88_006898 [Pleurodeles waltl]